MCSAMLSRIDGTTRVSRSSFDMFSCAEYLFVLLHIRYNTFTRIPIRMCITHLCSLVVWTCHIVWACCVVWCVWRIYTYYRRLPVTVDAYCDVQKYVNSYTNAYFFDRSGAAAKAKPFVLYAACVGRQ